MPYSSASVRPSQSVSISALVGSSGPGGSPNGSSSVGNGGGGGGGGGGSSSTGSSDCPPPGGGSWTTSVPPQPETNADTSNTAASNRERVLMAVNTGGKGEKTVGQTGNAALRCPGGCLGAGLGMPEPGRTASRWPLPLRSPARGAFSDGKCTMIDPPPGGLGYCPSTCLCSVSRRCGMAQPVRSG